MGRKIAVSNRISTTTYIISHTGFTIQSLKPLFSSVLHEFQKRSFSSITLACSRQYQSRLSPSDFSSLLINLTGAASYS
ncbi:hypothetical protein L6452_17166 [Arctium lappa]|uniref:Uncharacterized protein n=1 Tax=Arctium lappa TaxID=4217 RepID=A0ACB9C2U9_ARCLA|nr:hypothetical protein L6452_17166 [Arctium lappa]